jgi:hypothetical protein
VRFYCKIQEALLKHFDELASLDDCLLAQWLFIKSPFMAQGKACVIETY